MNFLFGSLLKVKPFIICPVQLPHLSFHRALPPVQQLLSSLPSPAASTAAALEPTEPCRSTAATPEPTEPRRQYSCCTWAYRALPPVQRLHRSLPSPAANTAAAPEPTEPCRQYSGYTGAYQALSPVQLLHLSLPSPAASAAAAPERTEPYSIFTHTRLEKDQRKKSAARIRSWMIKIITMIFIETKLHIRIGNLIKYRWLG